MGKVVTSAGLGEFITSGKVEEIKSPPKGVKAEAAPPLEVKAEAAPVDPGTPEPTPDPNDAPADDIAGDESTKSASDELKAAIAKKNATINRKHREMKEAREQAAEAEEFAKNQWNEKRQLEDRNAELEKELQELKAKAAPPAAEVNKKPDPQGFYDDKGQFKSFEYAEALAAYAAKQAVEEDRQRQAEAARAAEASAAQALAKTRIDEAIKRYPDYVEVTQRADVRTHNAVLQYLTASEHIGDVSYYLATNPDFVERINKLNPLKAIAEIGKLESTFEKAAQSAAPNAAAPAPAKLVTGAPAPIKPLSSQSVANINVDPSQMTFKELRDYERKRQRSAVGRPK